MKKLFYIGALSAFLLAACGEEEATPKEEKPVAEEKQQDEKANSDVPNTKLKKIILVKECGK